MTEAATRAVLCKKVFLEISQNSQENTCVRVSFSYIMPSDLILSLGIPKTLQRYVTGSYKSKSLLVTSLKHTQK